MLTPVHTNSNAKTDIKYMPNAAAFKLALRYQTDFITPIKAINMPKE